MSPRPDPLAVLHTIPRENIPAAIALLASRLAEPASAALGVVHLVNNGAMLTPVEAAMRLGVSRRWVWDHADRLGAARLGTRMLRIPAENVERELQARGTRRAG